MVVPPPTSPHASLRSGGALDIKTAAQHVVAQKFYAPGDHPDDPAQNIREGLQALSAHGKHSDVATYCLQLLKIHKKSPWLWNHLGEAHIHSKTNNKALACLTKAAARAPTWAQPYATMANIHNNLGKHAKARDNYIAALKRDPANIVYYNNYASLLLAMGNPEQAFEQFEMALELMPDDARLMYNYANALRQANDQERALEWFKKAADTDPTLTQAQFNMAQLLNLKGDIEGALPYFTKLLEIAPKDDRARVQSLHIRAQLNDWTWVSDYAQHRETLGLTGSPISPFAVMAMEDDPALQLRRTQAHAQQEFPAPTQWTQKPPAQRPEKLRIGYFSADFQRHATMHLMGGLFEMHDPSRYEIHAFSYGPASQDTQRTRLHNNVAQFHDVSTMTDTAAIDLAQNCHLDIAVDLKGYTGLTRTQMFGKRLAPLHVSYLGYPGTMGTPAFDYIITDSTVTPESHEAFFTERLLRMPFSYQVNDNTRKISTRALTRADFSLPEQGFVFCCFNNSYKITPREFDIWMALLAQANGSVLWLLSNGDTSETNLRREAVKRGIDPTRLVFAQRAPLDEHLARHKLADLFLDTFHYNAHTTCSDALWAGLPVLTLCGEQFSARVSASLLTAFGLPEMITESPQDYYEKALLLAQQPEALKQLRDQTSALRDGSALFNTKQFTRDLERAYDVIFARFMADKPIDHVTIIPQ